MRIRILSALVRTVYRFVRATIRPRLVPPGTDALVATFDGPERVIIAFWHDALGMVQAPYRGPGLCALISRHGDGEIIARAVEPLGVRAARGSATRGGAAGLRGMIRAHGEGLDLGVTVDGPRGPRHVVKPGVAQLARLTGAPVYPVACAAERTVVFRKSWDRFRVPWPFTRVYYAAGPPVRVERNATEEQLEAARAAIETELRRLTALVEEIVKGRREERWSACTVS